MMRSHFASELKEILGITKETSVSEEGASLEPRLSGSREQSGKLGGSDHMLLEAAAQGEDIVKTA